MKVAILSSASGGGAGIAAYRIYEAIKEHQSEKCDVDFIDMNLIGRVSDSVSPPQSATNGVKSNTHYTADFASSTREHVVRMLSQYDVLNIHWCSYLLSISEIHALAKRGVKIIFTLHDFYYLTGGCHYPTTCKQYLKTCTLCPQVDVAKMSQKDVEAAHKLKREIFNYDNVKLVAPSDYIVNKAVESQIVPRQRAFTIRNAYSPVHGKQKIPRKDSKINLLIIADSFFEIRKQLQLAVDGLKEFATVDSKIARNFILHLVGRLDNEVVLQLKPFEYEIINHGHISDHDEIVDVYCQCDYLLTPSLDDNWPNILVESASYGVIPIVGPGHGCEEFVNRFGAGKVFKSYDAKSIRISLNELLNINGDTQEYSQKVSFSHNTKEISEKYLSLF